MSYDQYVEEREKRLAERIKGELEAAKKRLEPDCRPPSWGSRTVDGVIVEGPES